MALTVIGAGVGRTGTFSLKFALEHLGFGPCYHMAEVMAGDVRRTLPMWFDVVGGKPDWDRLFEGFRATTDYPAASYWRELAAHYPDAKVVLSVRDPNSWFESVNETIFSDRMLNSLAGSPMETLLQGTIFKDIGGRANLRDRAFMTDWFARRNQTVIDTLPPERLLVHSPKEGWAPLCAFLGVPVPDVPFPRVNSRDEITHASDEQGGLPPDPEAAKMFARAYIDQLKAKAFAP